MIILIFSWRKNLYTHLAFGSAMIMSGTNFFLDLPYLMEAKISAAPVSFVFGILVRLIVLALLVSIFRNLDRSSYLKGKLFTNPFAPLKMGIDKVTI